MTTPDDSPTIDPAADPVLRWVREGVIGQDLVLDTPYGQRPRRYFDQTASGQPFGPIEDLIRERVLPWMANTHTEASATGRFMTAQFEAAHAKVREALGAQDDDVVLFTGSGATGAINKLIGVLGIRIPDTLQQRYGCMNHIDPASRPLVVMSRMEHHSNDLPWRESIAVTAHVGYDKLGRVDWRELDRLLSAPEHRDRTLLIGTFSAASNVTGVLSQPDELARVMHAHGGHACFDYAAAGPYVDVDLHPRGDPALRKDAVFISVHKFTGGPQTPGLLAANRALFRTRAPAEPGGGTVLYTSPWDVRYVTDLQHREEGGTPPIVQVIRAGLCFDLKQRIGIPRLRAIETRFVRRAISAWRDHPRVRILGDLDAPRIGVISVILDNGHLHYNLAVRLLNDLYGVQVRGGCMCAGTYGHDLLGIDRARSREIRSALEAGAVQAKPGWVRISFAPSTSEEDLQVVIDGVLHVADHWRDYADDYTMDAATAEWSHRDDPPPPPPIRLD